MRQKNHIVKLTFVENIAYRNGQGANQFLVARGFPSTNDPEQVAMNLTKFLDKFGEDGLNEILKNIHPDKELFTPGHGGRDVKHLNASGSGYHNCGGCATCTGSNFTGHDNCGGCSMHMNATGYNGPERTRQPNEPFDHADGNGPRELQSTKRIFNNESVLIMGMVVITVVALTAMFKTANKG